MLAGAVCWRALQALLIKTERVLRERSGGARVRLGPRIQRPGVGAACVRFVHERYARNANLSGR